MRGQARRGAPSSEWGEATQSGGASTASAYLRAGHRLSEHLVAKCDAAVTHEGWIYVSGAMIGAKVYSTRVGACTWAPYSTCLSTQLQYRRV